MQRNHYWERVKKTKTLISYSYFIRHVQGYALLQLVGRLFEITFTDPFLSILRTECSGSKYPIFHIILFTIMINLLLFSTRDLRISASETIESIKRNKHWLSKINNDILQIVDQFMITGYCCESVLSLLIYSLCLSLFHCRVTKIGANILNAPPLPSFNSYHHIPYQLLYC